MCVDAQQGWQQLQGSTGQQDTHAHGLRSMQVTLVNPGAQIHMASCSIIRGMAHKRRGALPMQ